ncbi:MAG TPA: winged helix-turn-helix domain-containing protein [Blastocatellia bacterium]|jgi:DNA-binding winged helix-turn-helix (wHTH) protein/TolB-like protein|nr:winged helix-turn-helix domain-containing protein [Blastocatellia bacterium]
MDKKARRLYEFDRFSLDASERILLHDQQEMPLTPKVFETLLLLVENNGRVLGKDELLQAIWPDSIVEESSLTQNISLLRKALGEGDGRRFIKTVPKRGYKFVAPVRVVNKVVDNGTPDHSDATEPAIKEEAATESAIKGEDETHLHRQEEAAPRADLPLTSSALPAKLNSGRKVPVMVMLLSLAVAGGAYFWATKRQGGVIAEDENRVRSLAALPFRALGNEGGDNVLGLGMADALILKLGGFDGLRVLTTSSIAQYAGRENDARELGSRLGVDAVLDGTIQRAGDRVRVTATLLDLRDGKILWSGKFDERFTDVFALQDSISEKVSGALKLQLAAGERSQPAKRLTESMEAYQMYSMGLYFRNRDTPESLSKALEYFRQATEKDPKYALAFATLADTYAAIDGYGLMPSAELREKAQAATARAMELDGSLPEAIAAVGVVKAQFHGDLEGAEQMYRRALDLNPSFGIVYLLYSTLLLEMDRLEESIRHMRRALEFDPLSPLINSYLSLLHRISHRPDEALKYAHTALEVDPNFWWARSQQGEAYEDKGMYREAEAEYRKITEMEGFSLYGKHKLIYLYAVMGRYDKARKLIAETQKQLREAKAWPHEIDIIAIAYVALGQKDKAFEWLNRAAESGALNRYTLRHNDKLDPLRSDPRFELLVRRLRSRRQI